MNYSAADLVKRSAAQIVYLTSTGTRPDVTPGMKNGEAYQNAFVEKQIADGINMSQELCGHWTIDRFDEKKEYDVVYFCVDAYCETFDADNRTKGIFTEVKQVRDVNNYPQWYFESALVQCAFYKAMLEMVVDTNILVTPKFRLDEGFPFVKTEVDRYGEYHLKFGDVGTFNVWLTNPDPILMFFKDKVESLKGYSTARTFDAKYKHKEYEYLREYIKFERI